MRVCLMIEGQEGVTWDEWVALARACEQHGIETLFRSDHYGSVEGMEDSSSLDAWTTLAALGAVTARLRLGALVSPVTFRHPSLLAKAVVTADHVSGGRVELGMGAGWLEQEHVTYGFPFPDIPFRMGMLAEQLEIVVGHWTASVFDFRGDHYTLTACRALPKPVQQPHPPLIIGGWAGRQSATLAAQWADEYNTIFADPATCRTRRDAVERVCDDVGRNPATMRFSLMTGCLIGVDRGELNERARRLLARRGETGDPEAFLRQHADTWVIGTVGEAVERLQELAAAGVERVMLQQLLHDDLEMVALIGREVAPRLSS
ncbi:MAG: TIGR03560 family F420-dependent LLM class oxidoreductase [Nitriliruptorales bacterium]